MATFTSIIFLISSAGFVASELCGTSGRQCAERATCDAVTATCTCDPPYWGNGFLHCYRPDQVGAQAYNDVTVTTFNNEIVDFPYPCRYVFVDIHQHLKDGTTVEDPSYAGCYAQVMVFNKRIRGKIIAHGFDVHTYFYNSPAGFSKEKSVRVYGIANNGTNNITILGGNHWSSTGVFSENISPNYIAPNNSKVNIRVFQDLQNSNVVYEFKACGIEVTFRPYDVYLRQNQPQVPGVFVGLNIHQSFIRWLHEKCTVAQAPVANGGIRLDDIQYPDLDKSQSLVHWAFMCASFGQTQPDKQPRCDYAVSQVRHCIEAKRGDAYNSCYWMLKEARFIRCVHEHDRDHLHLFERCMTSHCESNPNDCHTLKDEIKSICNLSGISKLTDFINGELC